jgi:Protein of unknown function (DUF2442)
MSTSTIEPREARALQVSVTDDKLAVDLADGRTVVVPLAWYPRLVHGTRQERSRWHLIGRGAGIHWPDLDEDISVEGLLTGRPSGESQRSLKRWLEGREAAQPIQPTRPRQDRAMKTSRKQPTDAEKQAARERFERHFGEVDLGYATGVDNEQIDADLARAYADRHR